MYTREQTSFQDRFIRELEETLLTMQEFADIRWEFIEGDGAMTLEVSGLADQPLTFTHSKSARAYLDGYLAGYDQGRNDQYDYDFEGDS